MWNLAVYVSGGYDKINQILRSNLAEALRLLGPVCCNSAVAALGSRDQRALKAYGFLVHLLPRKCQEEVDNNFEGLFKELKGGKAVNEFKIQTFVINAYHIFCSKKKLQAFTGSGQVMAQCQKAETCVHVAMPIQLMDVSRS